MSQHASDYPVEIFLVRHTKVALSKDYCYGASDVELADTYPQDINKVKNKLKGIDFQKSYSSPLQRCRKLADVLVNSVLVENDLMEMSLGDWELQKWADLDQNQVNDWMNDFVNINPPNSENYMEFSMKPVFFFDSLIRKLKSNDRVLIVSHSGPVRAIICHVLNLPLTHAFNFEVDFGSVSKIEVIDGWCKLKYLNY